MSLSDFWGTWDLEWTQDKYSGMEFAINQSMNFESINKPEFSKDFVTLKSNAAELTRVGESSRGNLVLAGCQSAESVLERVAARYQEILETKGSTRRLPCLKNVDREFTGLDNDTALRNHFEGADVFLIQSLFNPSCPNSVEKNYMDFLIAVRAVKENGARHVTGVLPYLPYTRHHDGGIENSRKPTVFRLTADLSLTSGMDRLITMHAHSSLVKSAYGKIPVHLISPFVFYESSVQRFSNKDDIVVVASSARILPIVQQICRKYELRYALAEFRNSSKSVLTRVVGDLNGANRVLIMDELLDDECTLYALINGLFEIKEFKTMEASILHNTQSDCALEQIPALHRNGQLDHVSVTDTVPISRRLAELDVFSIWSITDSLCWIINNIHYNASGLKGVAYSPHISD